MGSLARAAQKHSDGETPAGGVYWFYVGQPTPMFGLTDFERVIAQLIPGTWYLAKATYHEWVHAADENSNMEGWIAGWAVEPAP